MSLLPWSLTQFFSQKRLNACVSWRQRRVRTQLSLRALEEPEVPSLWTRLMPGAQTIPTQAHGLPHLHSQPTAHHRPGNQCPNGAICGSERMPHAASRSVCCAFPRAQWTGALCQLASAEKKYSGEMPRLHTQRRVRCAWRKFPFEGLQHMLGASSASGSHASFVSFSSFMMMLLHRPAELQACVAPAPTVLRRHVVLSS
jgi:hypothetical protein